MMTVNNGGTEVETKTKAMNAIEAAVMPQKMAAIKRSVDFVMDYVGRCAAELEKAGNDLHICAPYPHSRMSKREYVTAVDRYHFFRRITEGRERVRRPNDPELADISPERVERYVNEERERAAIQYDAYVAKLVHKIGPVQSAMLTGGHVWSYSFLHVVTDAGLEQTWKTQQIINVSCLGRLFNQWPTRLLKAGK
jgi:hypothetical protein